MSRGKLIKILLRAAFVLAGVTVFTVGSFSLARYVNSEESQDSAGVAGLGIKFFELTEGSRRVDVDETQVVPGVDITVPRISLHLESEVSYTLYLRVTEGSTASNVAHNWASPDYTRGNAIIGKDAEGNDHDVVSYRMAPWWTYEATESADYTIGDITYHVKYYKYDLSADTGHENAAYGATRYLFKPLTEYNYTDSADGTIGLLADDAIIVSQYYGVHDNNPPKFTLGFEAYIRQEVG